MIANLMQYGLMIVQKLFRHCAVLEVLVLKDCVNQIISSLDPYPHAS